MKSGAEDKQEKHEQKEQANLTGSQKRFDEVDSIQHQQVPLTRSQMCWLKAGERLGHWLDLLTRWRKTNHRK